MIVLNRIESTENLISEYLGVDYVALFSNFTPLFSGFKDILILRYQSYVPDVYISCFENQYLHEFLFRNNYNINVIDIKDNFPYINDYLIPYGNVLFFNDFLGIPDTKNYRQFDLRIRDISESIGGNYIYNDTLYKTGSCVTEDICYASLKNNNFFKSSKNVGIYTTNNKKYHDILKSYINKNKLLTTIKDLDNLLYDFDNLESNIKLSREIHDIYFENLIDSGKVGYIENMKQYGGFQYFDVKSKYISSNHVYSRHPLEFQPKTLDWYNNHIYLSCDPNLKYKDIKNNIELVKNQTEKREQYD